MKFIGAIVLFLTIVSVNAHWKDIGSLPSSRSYGSLRTHSDIGNNDRIGNGGTITVQTTVDILVTATSTVYNSIPVTLTNFVKSTFTRPTRRVVETAADDVVRISSVEVTRPQTTTVTDVSTHHDIDVHTSTEIYSILHVDEDIKQKKLTSAVVKTEVYRPTIVRTILKTRETVVTITNSPLYSQIDGKYNKFVHY